MTRYIVIGAGAVGASTAAGLYEAGREVVLIARGEHFTHIRDHGLNYVRPDGVHVVRLPVAQGPADLELGIDDVLVLATKAQDADAAVQQWAWVPVAGGGPAADELPIVLLQNGLDTARVALRRFSTVLDAVVMMPATYLHAGEVISPGVPNVGAIYLGLAPEGESPWAERVAGDLRSAGYLVQVVPDIARWKAGKLVGNISYNIDALYRPTRLRATVIAALAAEAHRVFAAAGRAVADPQSEGQLDFSQIGAESIPGHERGGSSTWQSLARNRGHEGDFLNGEIVLLARLAGIEAPLNRAVQLRLARAAAEGTAPGSLGDDDLAATVGELTDPRVRVLIEAPELAAALAGSSPPALLDVRWALGDAHGAQHYRDGHIPGAVFADLDTELADPPSAARGRHPLPSIERLQAAARGWGLHTDRSVVVYDDNGGLSAARAWWLLRWAGVADVRILDGALSAWSDAGFELATGAAEVEPGDIVLDAGHLPVITADEAAALALDGLLLDARAAERYRGEVEPVDSRAGHIPGAVSSPTGDNLDLDGRLRDTDWLLARLTDARAAATADAAAPVAVYCGSGVTAAHHIAALAAAGVTAALYPGSWSAWSGDPARPVATGAGRFSEPGPEPISAAPSRQEHPS